MAWSANAPVNRFDMSMGKTEDIVSSTYRNYSQAAACSMEQIFSPIQVPKIGSQAAGGTGQTPGYVVPVDERFSSNFPFGPRSNNTGPTSDELNPYFPNIFGKDSESRAFFIRNCDYNNVVHDPSDDYNLHKNSRRQDVNLVRTQALRAPVMLSGWGFDLADLPVPYSEGDVFNFNPDLVNNRATWKTGPLAVQWDEERQVWSTGPHILCGILPEGSSINAPSDPMDPTYFNIQVFVYNRSQPPSQSNGSSPLAIGDPPRSLRIINRDPSLEINDARQDIFCIVIRLNYEWLPLWIGCQTS